MSQLIRECMEIVEAGEPLVLTERPLPPAPPTGLIIKTSYAGVCHSDVTFWEDETRLEDGSVLRHRDVEWFSFTGITLGHEIAGIVHSIGDKVTGLSPGDRVVLFPWIGCTQCDFCIADFSNLCPHNSSGNTDYGQGTVGLQCKHQGGYSTYVWVSDTKHIVPVPLGLDMRTAVTLTCAGLTAFAALLKVKATLDMFTHILDCPTLVVNGCGGVGIWCLNLAPFVLSPKTRLIAMDISESKLDLAVENGARETILLNDNDEECLERLKRVTNGGACAVIDFVALTRTVDIALKSLRKGGQLHLIGLYGGLVSVRTETLIGFSVTLTSSRVGTVSLLRELVNMVTENKIAGPPVDLVSLTDVNQVFLDMKAGKSRGRTLVEF